MSTTIIAALIALHIGVLLGMAIVAILAASKEEE